MGYLFLEYNSQNIQDGYFAQLQRQIGIFSVSRIFRCEYLHSDIKDLTVTQLDDFQSREAIDTFLENMNQIYKLPSSGRVPYRPKKIQLISLSLRELIKLKVSSYFSREDIIISLTIPYRIIEKKIFINQLPRTIANFLVNSSKSSKQKFIVLHIRRGVNIEHVVPGEKSQRVLNDEYFLNAAKKIMHDYQLPNDTLVIILTDAPSEKITYKPLIKDKEVWENEFIESKRSSGIEIEGHKFASFENSFGSNLQIIRGGNLQSCVELMGSADHFVMSRSSMSYVGALLNTKGKVYYPPDFWHKPLKKWVKIS
jgi:hypothetical protein